MHRRTLLGLLGLGLADVIASGCSTTPPSAPGVATAAPRPTPRPGVRSGLRRHDITGKQVTTALRPAVVHGGFPDPRPGAPSTVNSGPPGTRQIAITIDDGYDPETVSAYVDFAQRTGIHLTFNPNGLYAPIWQQHAATLRPLIERGQVQIGNHTFSHLDMKRLPDAGVIEELERNEEWIETTFGITSRPWYRPPFGFHDPRTDDIAGSLGFTKVLMWNGSLGDSRLLTQSMLLQQAYRYVEPGVILLGHANHPTVTYLYEQIVELIASRELTPVTLDQMFGTSRKTG